MFSWSSNMRSQKVLGGAIIFGLSIYVLYFVYDGHGVIYPMTNRLVSFENSTALRSKLIGNRSGDRYGLEAKRRKILMKLHQSNHRFEDTTQPSNDPSVKMQVQMNETDMETVYKQRLLNLEEACMRRGTPQITEFDPEEITPGLLVEKKHAIIYCNIPKVGSTFWKRVLMVLKSNTRYKSPYDLRLSQTQLLTYQTLKDQLSDYTMNEFLQHVYSFMFVRDPYARLFSGYENKIFHPNIMFWKSVGSRAVKTVRKNATGYALKAGYDVTFPEFVKYTIKLWEAGKKINGHFSPMHQKCDPCSMPYHFLGKLETMSDDSGYLLSVWKKMYPDFVMRFGDYEKEKVMDTGIGHIRFTFQAWQTIKYNVDYPFYNLLLRTWSDLHIRGLLSKTIPFPFSKSEVEHLSEDEVVNALREALDIPVNITAVKQQREEALIQAYRSVPIEDMEKLRLFVLKDCQLFGYDDRPEKLFNRDLPFTNTHLYMKGI